MAPPQSLADIIAGLNVKYDPQRQALAQANGVAQDQQTAQMGALDAAKTQGFQDIGNQANARGMLFSGFTPYEQAQYLSTKYLPAVANLNNTTASTINKNNAEVSTLTGTQQDEAQQTLSAQQKAYSDWQTQQQQLAQQLAIAQMKAQSTIDAANIRNNGGNNPTQAEIKQQDMATIHQALTVGANGKPLVGADGHVSQQTWNTALDAWTGAGYNAADFVKNNIQYVNQRYKGYHGFN
jgi:hypothetical protein